jgi:hypothetical protein
MRYVLFGGANYYASGGAADFLCAYDDLEEAKDGARYHLGKTRNDVSIEWAHVAEMKPDRTCSIVWRVSVGG